jgi:protein-S-isoprenylcysteine O-methyltransferase Ste14
VTPGTPDVPLIIKGLAAFLACPGVVAGILPVFIGNGSPLDDRFRGASLVPLAIGAGCLIWCVRAFLVTGRGTLAPWDPPKKLVVVGLYRFVRNPMYLAVLAIVLGWSLYFDSRWLALYLAIVAVGVHLRVTLHEEPWLRRQFGTDADRYLAEVPRWLPRFRLRSLH